VTKTCDSCAHGAGEGTIRFCQVKNGAAFDANATCDGWRKSGLAIYGTDTTSGSIANGRIEYNTATGTN